MDHVRERQLGALGLCAFSVVAVLFLPQAGWTAVGVVTVGSMLIATFGKCATTGKANMGERLLAVPLFVWNILIMGKLGRELSNIHEVESVLPGLLLLLLSAYGVKKGVVPVVGAVLVFFILGIFGAMYLFAIPVGDMGKLTPQRGSAENLVYGFLPILLLYMYKGEKRRGKVSWAIGTIALGVGAAMVTAVMGAPDFYTAAKSVNLFGTMERWEPLVAVGVTAGGFCLLSMLLGVNKEIWSGIWDQKKNFPIELMAAIAAGLILTAGKGGDRFWAMGTAVCWGIIPIITQLVVSKKKL